jgi:hypothetical protein
MQYIYHAVPEDFVGDKLVPLSEMHHLDRSLKEKYLEKYQGRESILERRIPILNCLWNDVVQFLPIHPRKIFELQVELGIIPEVPSYTFFRIDISLLEENKTVVFFKSKAGEENVNVASLADVDFDSLQSIPESTKDYFRSTIGTGELPFNYQFVPHILYRGSVDITEQKIISL